MSKEGRSRSPWLGLGDASRLLGVSPGTLRRWADAGQVASFVTPGGHRRFPRAVVESLVPARRSSGRLREMGLDSDRMAAAYRRRESGRTGWVASLSDAERAEFRDRGRALVASLLQHLDGTGRGDEGALRAALEGARSYGLGARGAGATLGDTVQGFLTFRSPFMGELARLARSRGLSGKEATDLLVRAEAAMDRLLIAVIEGHESTAAR
jgi:excisionase family DNA binding protein